MIKEVSNAFSINDGSEKTFKIDFPKKCPNCDTALDVNPIYSTYIDDENSSPNLFVCFFCPHCEMCFIGYYKYILDHCSYGNISKARLLTYSPKAFSEKKFFPQHISKLSPNFCEIYSQLYSAHQEGLLDICGMGYRKALEFLVKDYAIFLHPNDADKIKNMLLAQCIKEYIDNRRIKNLATASAWLGNDETHYLRKHQEYNVDDLVAFIEATVSFINSDLSAEIAENLIKSKNSKN